MRELDRDTTSPDHTQENRSTYDRIAPLYEAEHNGRYASGTGGFVELRDLFLEHVPHDAVVADLGCGPGHDAPFLSGEDRTIFGMDLSQGMLTLAARRFANRAVLGDLRALPFCDEVFDGIWNAASLLHVPEVETSRVLGEFRRVLKASGWLGLITAVEDTTGFEDVPYAPGERRWFVYRDASVLAAQLAAAGFEIVFTSQASRSRTWFSVLALAV